MHRWWVDRQICLPIKCAIVTCLWNRIHSWHCNCYFCFRRAAKLPRICNKLLIISSICGSITCMLCKIRCNIMNPLYGALPGLYVAGQVTRSALFEHGYTYAPLCCAISQYCMTFISLSVYLWNDVGDHIFDGVWLAHFKSRANAFLLA